MEFLLCAMGVVVVLLLCSMLPSSGADFIDISDAGSSNGDGGSD